MNSNENNAYLVSVHRNLPRLLALFNRDRTSPMVGIGDRYHWAWKLIDFGNGTYQGAAHGFARLLVSEMLPEYFKEQTMLSHIEEIFQGAERLCRKNGSMEEAFPYESSFCVTALVAFDLLSAIELMESKIDDKVRHKYIVVVRPMIQFLCRAKETHAYISNHLATAAAALFKWHRLTGESGESQGQAILHDILAHQSAEGWFLEYEGADPGYQSLCTHYLADIHRMRPDLKLLEPLRRSIQFLWRFAHPDGSFGGLYGSRNTRFYYPAGVEFLAREIPEAAVLAEFMGNSISNFTTITLDAMDEPNLIPMFNSYCWAAELLAKEKTDDSKKKNQTSGKLPALSGTNSIQRFPQAGLLIASGPEFYTIISSSKGGVCYHFNGEKGFVDGGVVAVDNKQRFYSTQAFQHGNKVTIENNTITIISPFTMMCRTPQTPLRFLLLRLLNVTLMRNARIGNLIKKALVRLLITAKKRIPVSIRRTILVGPNCKIQDEWQGEYANLSSIAHPGNFVAIHMASQGYWQKQDEREGV